MLKASRRSDRNRPRSCRPARPGHAGGRGTARTGGISHILLAQQLPPKLPGGALTVVVVLVAPDRAELLMSAAPTL